MAIATPAESEWRVPAGVPAESQVLQREHGQEQKAGSREHTVDRPTLQLAPRQEGISRDNDQSCTYSTPSSSYTQPRM